MKFLVLLVFGAGLVIGSAYYLHHSKTPNAVPSETATDLAQAESSGEQGPVTAPIHQRQVSQSPIDEIKPEPALSSTTAVRSTPIDKVALSRAVDVLVSPQASYEQKQATWKQLKDSGTLDQAIHDLEQRTANNPASPESAAALGQAYLQKCGTTSDVREQGIMAMQADKAFDAALNLDPANWEARFTKAVALSYWPATMNKGEEVIQHFLTLIQQQETQPQQPQFAETYLWLGDQYQKAGQKDDARSVWERGASLFPDQEKLKSRLVSSP
jgi:tetratricopeptide (TPR) repeat protein